MIRIKKEQDSAIKTEYDNHYSHLFSVQLYYIYPKKFVGFEGLHFHYNGDKMPFRKCSNFQARMVKLYALKMNLPNFSVEIADF